MNLVYGGRGQTVAPITATSSPMVIQPSYPRIEGAFLPELGAACNSLGLYFKTYGNNNKTLWITGGIVNGIEITEQQLASGGSGYVFARTTINESTGALAGSSIITGTTPKADTFTEFYFVIGFYSFTEPALVRQDHCGRIYGYSCRVQYSNPARFSWRYYS